MRRRDLFAAIMAAFALPGTAAGARGRRSGSSTSRSTSRSHSHGHTPRATTPRESAVREPSPRDPTPAPTARTTPGPITCTQIAPCTGPDGARYFTGPNGQPQFLPR